MTESRNESRDPVAIVGIGCRFAKASTPAELWALMMGGVNAITEMPRDRFDLDALFDPKPGTPGKIMTRYGGFVEGIDQFDAPFFGISPREADRLDPQQRLMLEVAANALDDAGYVPEAATAAKTSVFVGMWLKEYEARLFRDPAAIDFYMTTGSGGYSASGRLSYFFGFEGPSVTVDTACSSSLVAIHLACQSLRSGESEMALAGGVNLILEPWITIAFSQSRMMAADGRCKFGDARADGYVRSDGAGMVVLKRLSKALADGDRIYAVIRGGAVNNDGRSSGFLATPGRAGQEEMLRRAYDDAGVPAGRVQYVEAHGTGTRAGDPVELGALGAVLREGRSADAPCRVGSIKTNIGHTEGAAGVAGVIKVALSLAHGLIPPSLHFETPNPDIPWSDLPLRVQAAASEWPDTSTPPIAGVSGFGIAGTNAHVVLQQHKAPVDGRDSVEPAIDTPRLLAISSHGADTLRGLEGAYAEFLGDSECASLADVCYTSGARRVHQSYRSAFVAGSRTAMRELLVEATSPDGALVGARGIADGEARKVVFVFPGQGSQWIGMGRELFAHEPVFRRTLTECDAAISALQGWSLIHELHAEPGTSRIGDIDVVQPALFAIQVSLAALWRSWGVHPDAVVGHSMGEVAAAYVAGALSLDDAVKVICRRSALLRRVRGQGAMAVVELSLDQAAAALAGFEDRVAVAVSNSSRSSVLSGDPAALDAIVEQLERRDVFCRLVKVDVASHSPQMDPLRADLLAALQGLQPRESATPIYSTVTGSPAHGAELTADYWVRNLRQPVLFSRTVARLLQDGHVTFVEMSPHPLLSGAVQEVGREAGAARLLAVGSTRRDEGERATMLASLAQLYVRGHEIDWLAQFPGEPRVVSLPAYKWQKERFWYDAGSPPSNAAAARAGGVPGEPIASAVHAGTFFWDFELSLDAWPELRDHRVRGAAIVPATAYVELFRSAAVQLLNATAIRLDDVTFDSALTLDAARPARVQIFARLGADGVASLEVLSAEPTGLEGTQTAGAWIRHATCRARVAPAADQADSPAPHLAEAGETRTTRDVHYQRMNDRGLNYGPAFQGVTDIVTIGNCAHGRIDDREPSRTKQLAGPSGVGPERLDSALQVLVSLAPEFCGALTTYVPTGAASIVLRDVGRHGSGLVADAALTPTSPESDGTILEGDVTVRDSTGETLVKVRGLRMQRVAGERSIDDLFYKLAWSAEPLANRPVNAVDGVWLALADRSGVGADVAAALAARGAAVVIAYAGERFARHDDGTVEMRRTEKGDYTALLNIAVERGALRGIVHLSDDSEPSFGTGAYDPSALLLAQACASAGLTLDGGLAFVTKASQRVVDGDRLVGLEQSPVWGFNSVLRTEHPELRSSCIDLADRPGARDLAALVEELTAGLHADRVAFREGLRHVARLTRADIVDAAVPNPLAPSAHDGRPFRVGVPKPGILDEFESRPMVRRSPRGGEVEIEVEATGLNFMNVMSAMGIYPGYPDGVGPLGIECAGRVSAVGADVRDLAVGDEVVAIAFDCLATHATTDARLVVRRPASLSANQAAGTPIAFVTSAYALIQLARIAKGDRVLIHSAAGGVGLAAIQLAHRAGAEVFATAGTEEKRALLRSLGVQHVFDSRSGRFAEAVLAATAGEGVDVVLNSLAGDAIAQGLSVLRPFGRFVEIGKRDIYENRQIGLLPFQRNLSYFAVDLDRMTRERPDLVGSMFRDVMQMLAAGEIQPLPFRAFELPQAAGAFREMAQGRHTGKLVIEVRGRSLPRANRHDPVDAAAGGTVLITGGLGALGLTIADWLVGRGIDHVAFVSRSSGSEAAQATVRRLEARGAVVCQLRANVSDRVELSAAIDELRRTMPAITGVVHAAGYLDDATVLQQEVGRFAAVMRPKIAGALNLDRLTAADPLQFFVLMGSVASFVGSSGQSNYAAGNAFLDALAETRRQNGQPALTVSWGPWSGSGLAARADRGDRLGARGLGSLTPEQGVATLERLLRSGETQVAVMAFDVQTWMQAAGSACLPTVAAARIVGERTESPATEKSGLREALAEVPAGRRRRAVLETWVREQVAQVLRMPAGRVESTKPFRTMGLDSLMGLELRNRIEVSAGVSIPATAIWNHPTVAQLAGQIAARMGVALEAPAADVAANDEPEVDAQELEALISELERLSEEEAQRLVGGDK